MSGSDGYDLPDPSAINPQPESHYETAAMSSAADALMALAGVVMVGETLGPDGKPAFLVGLQGERFRHAIPPMIEGRQVVIEITGTVTPY